MVPVAACPSNANIAPGVGPEPWHCHGLQRNDIDPDCSKVIDLNMALYHMALRVRGTVQAFQISIAPVVTKSLDLNMATGGCSDLGTFLGPSVAAWVMDISTDPGDSRTMVPDMSLGSSPGLETSLGPGGKQDTPISLLLTTFIFQSCLFP